MSKYKIRSLNDKIIGRMRENKKYKKKGFIYTPISFSIKDHPEILKIINKWCNRIYDTKMIVVSATPQFETIINNLSNISKYSRNAIINYDKYLNKNFERSLFWDKAQFIRSAIIFYTIMKREKKDKEIEKPIENKNIKKLENPNSKIYPFKPNQKPKDELNVYPYDLYKRLILSFLNENDYLTLRELADFTGSNTETLHVLIHQGINKEYPDLITRKKGRSCFEYSLDKEVLEEVIDAKL